MTKKRMLQQSMRCSRDSWWLILISLSISHILKNELILKKMHLRLAFKKNLNRYLKLLTVLNHRKSNWHWEKNETCIYEKEVFSNIFIMRGINWMRETYKYNKSRVRSFNVEFLKQLHGKKSWHHKHKCFFRYATLLHILYLYGND